MTIKNALLARWAGYVNLMGCKTDFAGEFNAEWGPYFFT